VNSMNLMNKTFPTDSSRPFLDQLPGSFAHTNKGITTANQPEADNFVYVTGFVNASFPGLSLEKELYQSLGPVDSKSLDGINDEVALDTLNQLPQLGSQLYKALKIPGHAYIAREMHWTLNNADDNEIYRLLPNSNQCLQALIAAISPSGSSVSSKARQPTRQVIIVGREVSSVTGSADIVVSHMFAIDTEALTRSIVQEQSPGVEELFGEILSLSANDGNTDAERALNYAVYNNPLIYRNSYSKAYESRSKGPNPSGYQLENVRVVGGARSARVVAKVVFDYRGINSGAKQSWYCSVDVTGEYPFLVTPWARFLSQH